jgi:hypothetical protein
MKRMLFLLLFPTVLGLPYFADWVTFNTVALHKEV